MGVKHLKVINQCPHTDKNCPWTKLGYDREHEIEGVKEGEKLNFELCFTRLSFIKVTISVTHTSIYSLGSFLEKLP